MSGWGRHFLRMKVITRDITVHNIITNVNKSLYVTMDIIPFRNVRGEASPSRLFGQAYYSIYNVKLLYIVIITCYNVLSKAVGR